MYFTWAGLDVNCQPNGESSKTVVVEWSSFASSTPHEVYLTSQLMLFLSFFFGLLLALFLILGFITPTSAKVILRRYLGGEICMKFIALVCGALCMIFAILAVGLFFRFPDALKETGS